jgi:hypothetical protein
MDDVENGLNRECESQPTDSRKIRIIDGVMGGLNGQVLRATWCGVTHIVVTCRDVTRRITSEKSDHVGTEKVRLPCTTSGLLPTSEKGPQEFLRSYRNRTLMSGSLCQSRPVSSYRGKKGRRDVPV